MLVRRSRSRRKRDEKEEGVPAWLVTYADMMTLILAFFVLMFSFSVVQETKFKAALGALRMWLGLMPLHTELMPGELNPAQRAQRDKEAFRKGVLGENIEVMTVDEGRKIVVGGRVLFGGASSRLMPEGSQVLKEVADRVRGMGNRIEIRGHSSPGEAATGVFEDEWELGWARARAVARYFVDEAGIRADRLRISTGGSVDPAAPNLFKDEASRNRRVEVVVTGELVR